VLRSAYGPITGGLGGMLALKWKTLSGSCRTLRAVRRARRLPQAAWTPEVPSKASGRGLDGRSRDCSAGTWEAVGRPELVGVAGGEPASVDVDLLTSLAG
jgi:hypothetical protein